MLYRATDFNARCQRCRLSCGKAIPGQAGVPLNKVALVFISAYPGNEEVKQGATLVPSESKTRNAGSYLRGVFQQFDKDPEIPEEYKPFDDHVFKTNVVKCPCAIPEELSNAILACRFWLDLELKQLPKGVPIVLAGAPAAQSLMGQKVTLYPSMNKRFDINGHPTIVTFNPIEAERYTPRTGQDNKPVKPVLGSVPWKFIKHMALAKSLVKEFIGARPGLDPKANTVIW